MKQCDSASALPPRFPVRSFLAAIVALCGLIVGEAGAQSASDRPLAEIVLEPPQLVASAGAVGLDYGIRLKNLVAIRDQLRDGAYMVLEGEAALYRPNFILANSELARVPLSWSLRHDPLTREFILVATDGRASRNPHIDTLLREELGSLHSVLHSEEPLENAQTYLVKISLVLKYGEVPPWLQKAMFFWSWELSPKLVWEESFVFTDWLGGALSE